MSSYQPTPGPTGPGSHAADPTADQSAATAPGHSTPAHTAPAHAAPGPVDDRHAGDRQHQDREHQDRQHQDRQPQDRRPLDRHEVVAREKEQFGGMKLGTGFFGWLTATGMAVVLLALLAAAGAVTAGATQTTADDAAGQAAADPAGAGLVGGIVLLVVLLLSYFCGGYVAGRMARFNGVKQGIAVFLWAVIVTVVLAVVALVAGSQYDVLSQLNLPTLPGADDLTVPGIVTLLLVVVVTLGGAMLGGLAGMRFHRKVDKAGLGR